MDGSCPAHMYSHTEDSILISLDSNVLSSSYEDLVGEIEADNVAAGTGSCGTNGSGTSITCYQRTEDGVITLTAVPEEISVEGMAVFVNQYRSEEHTSELQSRGHLVCRLLLEKKKRTTRTTC